MFDSDLAELYGVETKVLNQAVKRNAERFPEDFAFVPTINVLQIRKPRPRILKIHFEASFSIKNTTLRPKFILICHDASLIALGGPVRYFILLTLLFSLNVFAKMNKGEPLPDNSKLQDIFEAIKDVPVSYDPDGAVCEQVARVELQKIYPIDQYDVAVGIEYQLQGPTIGELDMIVFDKRTNDVVQISEVKCWKSYKGGLEKAMEQRQRFTWVLQNNPKNLKLISHEGKAVSVVQFLHNQNYKTISQLGGVQYGFDQELPYTLRELKRLRAMLLRCKVWVGCAERVGD